MSNTIGLKSMIESWKIFTFTDVERDRKKAIYNAFGNYKISHTYTQKQHYLSET